MKTRQLVKKVPVVELVVMVTADEYQGILDGVGAIKKRVCKLWEQRLMNENGTFKKFNRIRVKAHGMAKDIIFARRTICKTSIGKKPNSTPVFAIKVDCLNFKLVKREV